MAADSRAMSSSSSNSFCSRTQSYIEFITSHRKSSVCSCGVHLNIILLSSFSPIIKSTLDLVILKVRAGRSSFSRTSFSCVVHWLPSRKSKSSIASRCHSISASTAWTKSSFALSRFLACVRVLNIGYTASYGFADRTSSIVHNVFSPASILGTPT